MKNLIPKALVMMVILASCGPQHLQKRLDKRCQRHMIKAINGRCLDTTSKVTQIFIHDTLIKEHIDTGSADLFVDSSGKVKVSSLDSSLRSGQVDTIIQEVIRMAKVKPVHFEDSTMILDMWIQNGQLKFKKVSKAIITTSSIIEKTGPAIKTPCPDPPSNRPFWIVIGIMGFTMILFLVLLIITAYKFKQSLK